MERSRKNRKFSFKYRIEKWFYEDSKKDCKKVAIAVAEMLSFILMISMIIIVPALLH